MEGLRVIAHREGSASYEGSTPPCNLYSTNFSVWECIIIIGVGVGVPWVNELDNIMLNPIMPVCHTG